jgi:mono/diheme cytochrome c family protein
MRILLSLILLGFTALGSTALLAQTPTGDAANGKRLFLRDGCYQCHGYGGQGGAAGARIAAIGLNAQGLIRYVRAPAGQMPAYTAKVVSDQELTDIHAYLQTLPKAKPAKDIPLLNALEKK